MLKRVEEDWSFFNQAVREKAEGKPRQEVPPLKLVPLGPPPALTKPAPPMQPPPPPVQPPSAAPTATASPLRPRPLVGRGIASVIKLLFGIIAIAMLIALIQAAWRDAHPINSAATGTGPGTPSNGTVGTGAAEKVVTDYTTFNTVAYRSWKVVTGWKFANSRAARPNRQYCYLEVLTTGGQQIYTIEERIPVRRLDMPEALIPGLDKAAWDEVATKCVWHH